MKTETISPDCDWPVRAGQNSFVASVEHPHTDLVLFHGGGWVGGSPKMLAWLAPMLATHGVRLVLPSYLLLKRANASVDDAISNALTAVKWFVDRPDRAKRLLIGGASAGGLLALHGLKQNPDVFSGIILMNPVTNTGKDGFRNKQIAAGGRTDISPQSFVRELPNIPALIVHPGNDVVVPIAQSEGFLKSWKNSNAQLMRWPECGCHGSFGLPVNKENAHKIICEFIMGCGA